MVTLLIRRWKNFLFCGVVFFALLVVLKYGSFGRGYHQYVSELSNFTSITSEIFPQEFLKKEHLNKSAGFFHLIVPATRSNRNICRLLLSSTALGYPTPVFVNWGYQEDKDRYKEHLAKVSGTLRYLSRLPKRHDQDLALVVDGFDLWFQLRPEVLIQRYFEVIAASNQRLEAQIGREIPFEFRGPKKTKVIKNTLLFGPDKICWPEDPTRPACWAVPNSTLPEYAFGPETDSGRYREHYRPRWLNSGTIMGPISDIRRLLKATQRRIENASDEDEISDQYHMANLWGEQEYSRSLIGGTRPPKRPQKVWIHDGWHGEGHFEHLKLRTPKAVLPKDIPDFHITIDYESRLFQTMSYYKRYLGWIRYDGSDEIGRVFPNTSLNGFHSWRLPNDIASSPAPFHPKKLAHASDLQKRDIHRRSELLNGSTSPAKSLDHQPEDLDLPSHEVSWHNVLLGTNVISKQVFGVLHFTPPKGFRDRWWNRMWYFSYGRALMNQSASIRKGPYVTKLNGKFWDNYEIDDLAEVSNEHRSGGAFADSGAWNSWRKVCAAYERDVFYN